MARTGRAIRAAACALLPVLLVPSAGRAEHCDSDVVILSRAAGVAPAVNVNYFACRVHDDEDDDTRLITPGSTQVSVRYDPDNPGVNPQELNATITGLGLQAFPVTLTWQQVVAGISEYAYQSQWVPIYPTAAGEIKAVVQTNGSPSVTYHTVGS
jgi:hypothetical protein